MSTNPTEVLMNKWPALLLACVALFLVAPGCGGDDDDDGGGGGGGGANTQEPAAGGGGGGGGTKVVMKNIQFDPAETTVSAGDTVTWTNDESVAHDVDKESGPGPQFSSGPQGGMNEGDTFKHTFDKPGTYKYICRVHAPGMAGTIIVK
jgi:plastocyanin